MRKTLKRGVRNKQEVECKLKMQGVTLTNSPPRTQVAAWKSRKGRS
jgi:hypothetical protein